MPQSLRQSNPNIAERVRGFNLLSRKIDGNDSLQIYSNGLELAKHARSGLGPALLECETYRWLAHVGPDVDEDIGYRRKKDIDYWKTRCPINALWNHLLDVGVSEVELQQMQNGVWEEVENSVAFARASDFPS
jgi:pyruvate dehydrogenase E1 component alpha subunit